LPSDKIAQAIDLMDNIENEVDTLMENGIAKEDLSDLLFERFWGRNLECTLTDGSKIVGAAEAFDYDDTLYFEVKTSNGIVKLHKADVSFIKDLGFDE
jgi:biotin-(acetyl-CoA carboxylase) ligase